MTWLTISTPVSYVSSWKEIRGGGKGTGNVSERRRRGDWHARLRSRGKRKKLPGKQEHRHPRISNGVSWAERLV
jgi:hypothetical protein